MKRLLFLEDEHYDKAIKLLTDRGFLPKPADQGVVMECADKLLFHMGVPPKVKGYRFLIAAICIKVLSGVGESISITKVIYPDVAKQFATDALTVERDMRFALDSTWKKGLNIYYHKNFQRPYERPSNSVFIATAAQIVLERLETESFGG